MSGIVSCFTRPDALIASIDSVEARIAQRHHGIHDLSIACRLQLKAVATSWPALIATGIAGFIFGAHIRHPQSNLASDREQPPGSKSARALKFAARAFLVARQLL